ncbi:hypothetical protein ACHHYP_20296 [Achlya hypogyna]|uniref:Myb-like domain-containing protein n=1 Tax=Achlya hypogyna TaxID=1202772 RepID=A0A1V9YSJ7_ACHHY|nr:hypothetical protein ACHHYP_20296 [Achlya hypogyna]
MCSDIVEKATTKEDDAQERQGRVPNTEVIDVSTKKRWTKDDDNALQQQANLERPFLLSVNKGIAWDNVACSLRKLDSFSRQNTDGKKASSRFLTLMTQHKSYQENAEKQSGVSETVTKTTALLDELLELYLDNETVKKEIKKPAIDEAKVKATMLIREQAMLGLGRRGKEVEGKEDDDSVRSTKRRFAALHEQELALEHEKLKFKTLKLQMEKEEREKDREERAEMRRLESARTESMIKLLENFC